MAYRVKDDVTREQLIALVEALNPFYGFGAVLAAAQQEDGFAWVDLYSGKPEVGDGIDEQPDGCTADIDDLSGEGLIVGVNASWIKLPTTYCGPILTAGDFFAARDAFLACIVDQESK